MQVWYDYYMYECDHKLVPVVYGYMHGEIMDKVNNHEIIYGGFKRAVDSSDWFCMRCLEDINP